MAKDNRLLGQFKLDGIPLAPRGLPQIEVTFDIDANGILSVTAKDKGTGKEQNITITGSTNLDQAEIERMVEDAKRYAKEDQRLKEEANMRNEADALAYGAERLVKELEQAPAGEKGRVETLIGQLRKALDDKAAMETIRSLTVELQQAAAALEAAGAASREATDGQGAPADDVVDAEFEEN